MDTCKGILVPRSVSALVLVSGKRPWPWQLWPQGQLLPLLQSPKALGREAGLAWAWQDQDWELLTWPLRSVAAPPPPPHVSFPSAAPLQGHLGPGGLAGLRHPRIWGLSFVYAARC